MSIDTTAFLPFCCYLSLFRPIACKVSDGIFDNALQRCLRHQEARVCVQDSGQYGWPNKGQDPWHRCICPLLNKIVKSAVGDTAEQYYGGNFTLSTKDFKQRTRLLRTAMIVPKLVFDGLNQGVHANYTLFI